MRDAKKHGNMSKMILGMKKSRKKILCKDGAQKESDQHNYGNCKIPNILTTSTGIC